MSVVYSDKFTRAVNYVLANEGGYVFDKNDPGGETKYGISKRSYPCLNIKALSLDEAKKSTTATIGLGGNLSKFLMKTSQRKYLICQSI